MNLLIDVMNDSFATKSDLNSMTQKLESSIRELEYKMTIKLGAMMTLAIGVTATLMRVLQVGR